MADQLLRRFGSFARLVDHAEEIEDLRPRVRRLVALVREMAEAYLKDRALASDILSSPQAVADYCRFQMASLRNEAVRVFLLDNRNAVVGDLTLFEGSAGEAAAYPRRVCEEALKCGSTGVILVHNHPSGKVSPSAEDRALTKRMAAALAVLDIRLLDHLVVGREGWYSFREAEPKALEKCPPGERE